MEKPNLSEQQWKQIDLEILAGRMIEAIKLHRASTGVGLKEAKDAVEARQKELLDRDPKLRAAAQSRSRGCMPSLLLFGLHF